MNKINLIASAILMSASVTANAGIIDSSVIGTGWSVMGSDDGVGNGGFLDPGYGGQYFDAEYLLYKYDQSTNYISILLQTGFDIRGPRQITYGSEQYWAGDLALSFDGVTLGDSNTYEYAIDLGHAAGTWGTRGTGEEPIAGMTAGLYSNVTWNNEVVDPQHLSSVPYNMDTGSAVSGATVDFAEGASGYSTTGGYGSGSNSTSYYMTMGFDLDDLGLINISQLDAHWTMSCGNDAINGHIEIPPTSVPEPSSIALFSTGLIGLLGGLFVRRKRNQQL
jgi:hypothetical protein